MAIRYMSTPPPPHCVTIRTHPCLIFRRSCEPALRRKAGRISEGVALERRPACPAGGRERRGCRAVRLVAILLLVVVVVVVVEEVVVVVVVAVDRKTGAWVRYVGR